MINLFGAGGARGADCPGTPLLLGGISEMDGGASEAPEAELLSALIWLEFEPLMGPLSASESSALRRFLLFLSTPLVSRSVGAVLEPCVAGGAAGAAGAFPTCRLLTTSLTPATDAA